MKLICKKTSATTEKTPTHTHKQTTEVKTDKLKSFFLFN